MATIGAEQGGGTRPLAFLMIAVFASALTEDEIKKLKALTKPGALEDRSYTFPRVVNFAGSMGGFDVQINDITEAGRLKPIRFSFGYFEWRSRRVSCFP